MWHSFWKDKRSWKDCKQSECLCRSSCPKGSLNKVFWEILQNSQENICTGIHFWRFHEICKNTFFAEQHQTTASDYSSINSSEGSTSSNVNEVIRATLNFFIFFFQKRFYMRKKHKAHISKQKQKRQHFYAFKKIFKEKKVTYWPICVLCFLHFLCFLCFLCF